MNRRQVIPRLLTGKECQMILSGEKAKRKKRLGNIKEQRAQQCQEVGNIVPLNKSAFMKYL